MTEQDAVSILFHFYPDDTPLRRLLLKHSRQVKDKAIAIAADAPVAIDASIAAAGALLHDLGIRSCDAPGILCQGSQPYILHGVIGANLLRSFASAHGLSLEPYARICERHTGSGLTAAEILRENLPLPPQDYLPETNEEILVCLADKFFSKSGDMCEKTFPRVRKSLEKFGPESMERFDRMCRLFQVGPSAFFHGDF